MSKIILASGSPRRKELSGQKAREVAERTDGSVVIGADTVVAVDGQILGKPRDKAAIFARLDGQTGS